MSVAARCGGAPRRPAPGDPGGLLGTPGRRSWHMAGRVRRTREPFRAAQSAAAPAPRGSRPGVGVVLLASWRSRYPGGSRATGYRLDGPGAGDRGGLVAGWWKYGLTGRHLTAGEAFQDILVTGLLAVCEPHGDPPAARLLDRAPPPESDGRGGRRAHLPFGQCLSDPTGKALDGEAAVLIAGTPYVVGSLMLLESGVLLRPLGGGPPRACATKPAVVEFLGRVLVLFGFNVAAGRGWRPGAGRSGLSGPIWRCWPSRPPRSRPRGSRPWGRVRPWPRGPSCCAGPHRPDDHALPGRAVGRGLPRHRHGHGRDPWSGPVA